MAYTPNNNPYIAGDPYSYDLKWIISKLKELINTGASLEQAIIDLRAWVIETFNNNIAAAVNAKLDEMAANGELELIIAKYIGYVTPQMYGAKGDGVNDDSAAIQAAIDANDYVYFPPADYFIEDHITITNSDKTLFGAGEKSKIIMSEALQIGDSDAYPAFYVRSAESAIVRNITANINKGAQQITIDNNMGVEAGQLVFIKGDFSTSPWTSDNRGYLTKGETNIVTAVNGNNISVEFPINDKYTSEIVTASFLKPLENIHIKGLNITTVPVADDHHQFRAIQITGAINSSIENVRGENCGMATFEFVQSVNSKITDCFVKNGWTYQRGTSTLLALGYALRDSAGTNISISNNTVEEARHAVDISGGYPAHNTAVYNNKVSSTFNVAVVNTHGTAVGSRFYNNIIYGLVSLSGEEIVFSGNKCSQGVQTANGRNYTIENNTLGAPIRLLPPDTNASGNYIIIQNNVINGTIIANIAAGAAAYGTVYGLVMLNNIVQNRVSSAYGALLNIAYAGTTPVTFTGGLIHANNYIHNLFTGAVNIPPLTGDMANTNIGATIYDSTVNYGLYTSANPPATNTIGGRAYRTQLHKPVWWNGTAWVDAQNATP